MALTPVNETGGVDAAAVAAALVSDPAFAAMIEAQCAAAIASAGLASDLTLSNVSDRVNEMWVKMDPVNNFASSATMTGAGSYEVVSAGPGTPIINGFVITVDKPVLMQFKGQPPFSIALGAEHLISPGFPWVVTPGPRSAYKSNSGEAIYLAVDDSTATIRMTIWRSNNT